MPRGRRSKAQLAAEAKEALRGQRDPFMRAIEPSQGHQRVGNGPKHSSSKLDSTGDQSAGPCRVQEVVKTREPQEEHAGSSAEAGVHLDIEHAEEAGKASETLQDKPWDPVRCSTWQVGFGQHREITYAEFYERFPLKVGSYFLYLGKKRDSQHGPLTKTQRKFLRWCQWKLRSAANIEAELARLAIRDNKIRKSLLEADDLYAESKPQSIEQSVPRRDSSAKNDKASEESSGSSPPAKQTQPHRPQPETGASSRSTTVRGKSKGSTALSRCLWSALEDPALPPFPFGEGEKRWAGTSGAQEAWIRAVVEDLSDDHPGGWFYPPDGAQDVTPNIRKYQLWPFFFWRPQNTSWARLRSPDDPSAALPCIKDHRHTVRRAGFMSQGPRKVVARKGICYVLGERFRCTTCLGGSEESEINHDEDNPGDAKVGSRQKKKQALRFSSLHPDFLSKLPPDLISQIPAFFTYRKAIALDVLSDLRTLSVSGSASVCSARLLETQQTAYFRRRAQYELHCKEWEEASSKGRHSPFTCVKRVPPAGGFPNFGSMDHRDGWNVAASDRSREYLMAVYVQDFVIRQPTLAQELKSLSGRILKADHTRPLAGKVSSEVGVKWSYSVMNEYGEILCHAFTETDSDSQVQHLYAGLRARFDSLNVHHPRLIFVDKQCCGSTKEMIQRYFPAIQVIQLQNHNGNICKFSRSSHPGHAGFMKELSQAVFKVNENDMKLLIEAIMVAFGLQDPSDAVAKLKETPSWLYKYVRRQVPAKEELEERIMAVVDAARNVAWEGELLLPPGPEGFDRCLANQLHHVRMGCVSDVDDALYEELGIVHFQGKKEAPLMAYKCYRSSSQLEGIHGWQASYLSGTNVGPLATQALVTDGIMRYNRNVRRKSDGHKAVFPLYDNSLLLRLRSSSDGQLYPNLVMNAADTGETFGLEYTAAIRREMIEIEVGEMSKESPAETVADSEDIHRFEADAMAWSIDRVLEILEQEHSVQDIQRSERHSSATRAQSTSRRISKLRMFGRNSNFLQKARPESFTLLMKQKLDDLASAIGEQDVDEIHRQYYRWFLEQKLDDPNVPILDTSRFHVEAYLTRKKWL